VRYVDQDSFLILMKQIVWILVKVVLLDSKFNFNLKFLNSYNKLTNIDKCTQCEEGNYVSNSFDFANFMDYFENTCYSTKKESCVQIKGFQFKNNKIISVRYRYDIIIMISLIIKYNFIWKYENIKL